MVREWTGDERHHMKSGDVATQRQEWTKNGRTEGDQGRVVTQLTMPLRGKLGACSLCQPGSRAQFKPGEDWGDTGQGIPIARPAEL